MSKFSQTKADYFISIEVESHVVKKNNRPIHGRGQKKWIGKSNRLRTMEDFLKLQFRSRANALGIRRPLSGDIHAIFRFYITNYYTAKKERSRSIPDLSNLIQLPEDCLQAAGVIENDSDIVCLDGSGRFPGDKNILEIELKVLSKYEKFSTDWASK